MTEYVFRILARDPAHPLDERTVLEFGTPATDAAAFAEAVRAVANLLRIKGTPEAVAKAMEQHSRLPMLRQLILGR